MSARAEPLREHGRTCAEARLVVGVGASASAPVSDSALTSAERRPWDGWFLALGVSGGLAYTVAIERTEVLVVGQEKPAASSLRVTQIFRMEDGAWKLVHRHADPLINKTAPDAILQK